MILKFYNNVDNMALHYPLKFPKIIFIIFSLHSLFVLGPFCREQIIAPTSITEGPSTLGPFCWEYERAYRLVTEGPARIGPFCWELHGALRTVTEGPCAQTCVFKNIQLAVGNARRALLLGTSRCIAPVTEGLCAQNYVLYA